jgi:hypothetical protein
MLTVEPSRNFKDLQTDITKVFTNCKKLPSNPFVFITLFEINCKRFLVR